MAHARTRRTTLGYLLAIAFSPLAARSEQGDSLLATVGSPATITSTRSAAVGEAASRRRRVVVSVTEYHPSDDGSPVEVIVKGRVGAGAEREVGRFGITPDREFFSADPLGAQRFLLRLPPDLATDLGTGDRMTFTVHLVPVRGSGKGASLHIGNIEFF